MKARMWKKTRKYITHQLNGGHLYVPVVLMAMIGGFSLGFLCGTYYPKVLGKQTTRWQQVPLTPPDPNPDQPLRKYSIQNLQTYQFQLSEVTLEKVMEKKPEYTSYLFSYKTLGKRMTGQVHIPNGSPDQVFPVIVMVRGYVPPEEFTTGAGTRWQAAEFAKAGYVTVAPDFLGFGGSGPAGPGWEERFEKPVNVIELIKSLRQHKHLEFKQTAFQIDPQQMGIWAHSNGGQITLSTLAGLGEPIPATLWAPVTAPFPYSVLYFSDEMDDGGRGMRSAVAGFERVYNVQEYSSTQYMSRLRGPLQLHQGALDDAVPLKWSDEFVQRVRKENDIRREKLEKIQAQVRAAEEEARRLTASSSPASNTGTATGSAQPTTSVSPENSPSMSPELSSDSVTSVVASGSTRILADAPSFPIAEITTSMKVEDVSLKPIDINYFVYKTGDHGMFPNREEAIERDIRFFSQHLKGERN
jgi:pimeloyl-ACP methyl ester carboxylesterase